MSDHWTVLFEFQYKMIWKMVIAALFCWGVQLCITQAPTNQNTLIVQSAFSNNYFEVNQDICILLSSPLSTLNSYFWWDQVPIVMHDPMQYSGQTQIPCNSGQSLLTWTFKTWLRWSNPVSSLLPATNTTVPYICSYIQTT